VKQKFCSAATDILHENLQYRQSVPNFIEILHEVGGEKHT